MNKNSRTPGLPLNVSDKRYNLYLLILLVTFRNVTIYKIFYADLMHIIS